MSPDSSGRLGATELAVLRVLAENADRVMSREAILRTAGVVGLAARRCDSALVVLRRTLGDGAIITVRRRGWRLSDDGAVGAARLLALHDGLNAPGSDGE